MLNSRFVQVSSAKSFHVAGPVMVYTLTAFTIVQIGIWRMINTAREACSDGEQRRRLQFLRNVTPHVWNIFWAMWFCQYFGILSVFQAELGNMVGNFVAKVGLCPAFGAVQC